MSDTPRTDAQYGFVTALRVAKERVEASPLYERFIDGTPLSNDIAAWIAQTYCEGAEFARQLERELAEAREQRDRLTEEIENLKASGIHTCHDQCKRPMCVMRRERDRLAEALRIAVDPRCSHHERLIHVSQALAAVKGGSDE